MAQLQPEDLLTADERLDLDRISKRKEDVIQRIRALETKMSEAQHNIDLLGIDDLNVDGGFDDPRHTARVFNRKPKDTILKLIEAGVIAKNDDKAIASFLWNSRGLTKKAIGEYVTAESATKVLREFILLQGYTNTDVLTALRMFLNSFEMSGEGQIVDRVLMSFAECYFDSNQPSVFADAGNCHIFLYAVMLLQTSLHNPNVKNGMKSAEFIKLCECCQLPKEFLIQTYNEVKKRPFEHDKVAAATRGCLLRHSSKKGYLMKQSSRYWSWKKRWFVLMDHCLFYFEDESGSSPRGIISLENVRIRHTTEVAQHPFCLELYSLNSEAITVCKVEANGTTPKSSHANLRLAATTDAEMREWMDAIEQSSWLDEYQDLIQLQRNRLMAPNT